MASAVAPLARARDPMSLYRGRRRRLPGARALRAGSDGREDVYGLAVVPAEDLVRMDALWAGGG